MKSDGSESLLSIERGTTVKNCKKHGEKYDFFERIAPFFGVKERLTSESLTLIFFKE